MPNPWKCWKCLGKALFVIFNLDIIKRFSVFGFHKLIYASLRFVDRSPLPTSQEAGHQVDFFLQPEHPFVAKDEQLGAVERWVNRRRPFFGFEKQGEVYG